MPERLPVGLTALAAAIVVAAPAFAGDPGPPRQKELIYLLKQDCGSCHGMTLKGGLGPALVPEALLDKPDEGLVDVILNGRPGTPMPPWDVELTEDEANWLVRQLRNGIKK